MSMSDDIKDLKRQRREEIDNLHKTYLRTKRQVVRAVSPDRIIRKHLGVGLGVVALAGFLLAPRPSPRVRYVREPKDDRNGDSGGNAFSRWMHKIAPKIASFIPGMSPTDRVHEAPPKKKKRGILGTIELLMPVLTLVLKKLDLQSLVERVMAGVGGMPQPGDHDGRQPDVSVADAGTVKPTDFEHFD